VFEYRECDHGVGRVKSERAADDQPELAVELLDAGVGEAVLNGGEDPGTLRFDRSGELHERRQTAASGPREPAVKQFFGVLGGLAV